ncbi:arginine-tRNA-protein transferase 1 [Delitschia confertaspora ATCC 74209]|uniref:Arginyl-tRNA--protein transferase 1 n=1 Tax=Delitschia confertaspora ATCC 74209 TaxID=1513339 RepID=A0A9P4MR51_9PLEO|nr:arginine-tRNA-protein transferase 1 [Delitschia confertaspora ATCC 74209]
MNHNRPPYLPFKVLIALQPGASYYILSKTLTVDVYQALIDRGWRRSGTVLYKPDVLRHCCPHYTIRLPVSSFASSRDQRQAVNRWNKFVLGEEYTKEAAKLYPKSKAEKKSQRNAFDLLTAVHESEYANLKRPPEPAHRFEVTLELDDFTLEKYELFANYQKHVHHEKPSNISQEGFRRFLCASPLIRTTTMVNGKQQRLGSYHQCYRLDGRLIAMGVVDLLPHCVSGVYFIYHSDFEKWSFGKLSALREAALALEGDYQYYYMGYYIHNCVKMRYKGDYKPQYVLDPETYEWNLLDGELRERLDSEPYVSLGRERKSKRESASHSVHDSEKQNEGSSSTTQHAKDSFPLPEAADAGAAVNSGMSLFDLKVPGLMTVEEIARDGCLDSIRTRIWDGLIVDAEDLVSWEKGNIRDRHSLKGILAELVACVGPEIARQMVVNLC